MEFAGPIAESIRQPFVKVQNVLALLDEGATVPFIARYRKERTGSMDEVLIQTIKDEASRMAELEKRREAILKSVESQEKLSPELEKEIRAANTLAELEDLYLPYKPRKETRADKARKLGLEPLAKKIFSQQDGDPVKWAEAYLNADCPETEQALQGARDIVAEWINESVPARNGLRGLFGRKATIHSRLSKEEKDEDGKFRDYYDFEELLRKCPSHRLLAMRRGEDLGILKLSISPATEDAIYILERRFIRAQNLSGDEVKLAIAESYKRLLGPSMETEFRNASKDLADQEAIAVFAENLKQLLLSPPLGQTTTLAIDPGFRTGCKVVCLDAQGNYLESATIFPHPPNPDTNQAAHILAGLVKKHHIKAIAIGDGTAGRETEHFIRELRIPNEPQIYMVNENGASIYSASAAAREEFPDLDLTVRGSISIGRRLMDPLAELVKIDAKSIGVGQYQHDVDQGKLKEKLDRTVEYCVNLVGVNLNTASPHLLFYVSGLGPALAKNIVEYRAENGPFGSRAALKKVPRLGPKAFEQCAGFLRIKNAKHPLDDSSVHPESYKVVEKMAKDLGVATKDLVGNADLLKQIDIQKYKTKDIGLPTLKDILTELEKPGLDPRGKAVTFQFAEGIQSLDDLKEGMILPGIITNLTNFGAFVNIGVKQDGLIHISEIADRYIKSPADVLSLNEKVQVKVLNVDVKRSRVNLSMKQVKS